MKYEAIDPYDKRTARLKLMHGLMWCLIWLGFGGCVYLSSNHSTPLIEIKISEPDAK
jgi:hypothetical protein